MSNLAQKRLKALLAATIAAIDSQASAMWKVFVSACRLAWRRAAFVPAQAVASALMFASEFAVSSVTGWVGFVAVVAVVVR
ncbi:MAG: hypothetical protein NVSMB56_10800 [Pyrinomonadaceae bacterium]